MANLKLDSIFSKYEDIIHQILFLTLKGYSLIHVLLMMC